MLATTFTAELETFTGVLGRTLLSTFLLGICYLAINSVAKTFENPLRGDSRQVRRTRTHIATKNAALLRYCSDRADATHAWHGCHRSPETNDSLARVVTQAAAALPLLEMCQEMVVELGGLFREPIPPVAGVIDAEEEARRAKVEAIGSIQSPKDRRGGKALPMKALKVRTVG